MVLILHICTHVGLHYTVIPAIPVVEAFLRFLFCLVDFAVASGALLCSSGTSLISTGTTTGAGRSTARPGSSKSPFSSLPWSVMESTKSIDHKRRYSSAAGRSTTRPISPEAEGSLGVTNAPGSRRFDSVKGRRVWRSLVRRWRLTAVSLKRRPIQRPEWRSQRYSKRSNLPNFVWNIY